MCDLHKNLHENLHGDLREKSGGRCDICIGCGRCTDAGQEVSVVMKNALRQKTGSLFNKEGKRLVAVDIGTTTIAMQLYGMDGALQDSYAAVNPQSAYGADVLSRIQAAGDKGVAEKLQAGVRTVLGQGFRRFGRHLGEGESLFAVIAANTTMVYLLMGYDTKELGQAPFHASHLEMVHAVIPFAMGDVARSAVGNAMSGVAESAAGNATDNVIQNVECVILPGLSAFVGGDIAAGIHACKMAESEEITLLIDLGTNGEMALGNRERILVCATAAGPAFEGGVNRGVWGADMISLLAGMKKEGVLDGTGLIADAYFESGVRIGDVCVTQAAVRAVQLAKGAIRAGIHVLAKAYGIGFGEIKRVVLAGGFGYYLDPEDAAVIGLLPAELADRTVTGGNTALAGALRRGKELLSGGMPQEGAGRLLEKRTDGLSEGRPDGNCVGIPVGQDFWPEWGCRPEILNLAQAPGFEELYVRYMDLE